MAFDIRPAYLPRSVPFGSAVGSGAAAVSPQLGGHDYRARGVGFDFQSTGTSTSPTGVVSPPPGGTPAPTPNPGAGNNAPPGTSLIPGTPYVGVPGAGAPAPDLVSGGMTIPGTNLTQGRSTVDLTNDANAHGGVVSGPGGIPIYTPGATPPPGAGVGAGGGVGNGSAGAPFTWDVGQTPTPAPHGAGAFGYKKGGVIPEPVTGVGDISGRTYKFGEVGPERVVPATAPYKGNKSGKYSTGGTVGFAPQSVPLAPASSALPSGTADSFNLSAAPLPAGYSGSSGAQGGTPPPAPAGAVAPSGSQATPSSLMALMNAHKKIGKHLKGIQNVSAAFGGPPAKPAGRPPGHMSAVLGKIAGH